MENDSKQIALHHAKHLEEFAQKENLFFEDAGIEEVECTHHIAFIIVNKSDVYTYRDALKPKRALLV